MGVRFAILIPRTKMAVLTANLTSTVETLLENKRYNSVKDILVTLNEVDIAAILDDQPP